MANNQMIAREVIFEGRVQGVGFRYAVKDLAKGFDVCGSVKNLPEGSVELRVMGELEAVKGFIHEITVESNVAHHIQHHVIREIELMDGCRGFRIER